MAPCPGTLLAERIAKSGLRVLGLLDLTNCLYDDGPGVYAVLHEKLPHVKVVGMKNYSEED
jgi:hypothetical protein